MTGKRRLTKKQKDFANNYIKTGNVLQSALDAGYSENYAKAQSYKMLDNVGVKDYIDARLERVDKQIFKKQVEVHEALNKLISDSVEIDFTKIIKETRRYEKIDEQGELVQYTDETIPLKLSDYIKALELKAKLEGLFDEDTDIVRTVNITSTIPNMIGANTNKENDKNGKN